MPASGTAVPVLMPAGFPSGSMPWCRSVIVMTMLPCVLAQFLASGSQPHSASAAASMTTTLGGTP